MSIQIIKKYQQAKGAFDFGNIQENKPVGFPHEKGGVQSFSNLFYWAHAWSDNGGLIDTHPHQGFEIMSYVIDGEISHFDTHNDKWFSLYGGDAQLIQAGNGISHAERLLPNTKIFQIWFDPNLNESLKKNARYSDVSAKDFPLTEHKTYSEKTIIGHHSPLQLDTEHIEIKEYVIQEGDFELSVDENNHHTPYNLKHKSLS